MFLYKKSRRIFNRWMPGISLTEDKLNKALKKLVSKVKQRNDIIEQYVALLFLEYRYSMRTKNKIRQGYGF